MSALVLALLVQAAAPSCLAQPEPDPAPLPEEASAYLEVARERELAGDIVAALAAWRPLVRVPELAEDARAAVQRLCEAAQARAGASLAAGLSSLEAGRRDEAERAFEQARALASLPEADFFLAVVRLEAGDLERARALFGASARAPELAGPATAYQGVIALRTGRSSAPLDVPDGVRDPAVAESVALLRRALARGGRLSLQASLEAGLDSNPAYLPAPATPADLAGTAALVALFRPSAGSGPQAVAGGQGGLALVEPTAARRSLWATAGWRWQTRALHAQVDYAYQARWVGVAFEGDQHGPSLGLGALAGRWMLTADASWRAERWDDGAGLETRGWRARARLLGGRVAAGGSSLEAGLQGSRADFGTPTANAWEGGPALRGLWVVTERARLWAHASLVARAFDAGSAAGVAARQDLSDELRLRLEFDFTPSVTAWVRAEAQRQGSSDVAAAWVRLAASVGVSLSQGFFKP